MHRSGQGRGDAGFVPHPRHGRCRRPVSRILYPSSPLARRLRATAISLGPRSRVASSGLPVPRRAWTRPRRSTKSSLVRHLCGLAPDGVCRAFMLAHEAVGSYPTVSPLPFPLARDLGGLFSVALSVPARAGPGRYPASCPMESGLSSITTQAPRQRPSSRRRRDCTTEKNRYQEEKGWVYANPSPSTRSLGCGFIRSSSGLKPPGKGLRSTL